MALRANVAIHLTLAQPIHNGGVVMIFLKPSFSPYYALWQTQDKMVSGRAHRFAGGLNTVQFLAGQTAKEGAE